MRKNPNNLPPVTQTMIAYSKAQLVDLKNVSKDVTLSLWNNGHDLVNYHNSKSHTLSLYMKGGNGNQRIDKKVFNKSGENTLCLMPANHKSTWQIGKAFSLAHFYFSDDYLKQVALETFDKDPREIQLAELNFEDDPALSNLLRYGIFQTDWLDEHNSHFIDHAIQMIMLYLLQKHTLKNEKLPTIKGGLSTKSKITIEEYITQNIKSPISIRQLSKLVGLSEYHFARMFKHSFAITPHHYIQNVKIDSAANQIKNNIPLIEIAANCGFSSQSHLGRVFKQKLGVTPHQFKINK